MRLRAIDVEATDPDCARNPGKHASVIEHVDKDLRPTLVLMLAEGNTDLFVPSWTSDRGGREWSRVMPPAGARCGLDQCIKLRLTLGPHGRRDAILTFARTVCLSRRIRAQGQNIGCTDKQLTQQRGFPPVPDIRPNRPDIGNRQHKQGAQAFQKPALAANSLMTSGSSIALERDVDMLRCSRPATRQTRFRSSGPCAGPWSWPFLRQATRAAHHDLSSDHAQA